MADHPIQSARTRQTLSPFRLRRHADYQLVYAASRKFFLPTLAFFFRLRPAASQAGVALNAKQANHQAHEQTPGPRIGLTTPRALGKANIRNRIKRRMREAVRLELTPLLAPGIPPLDLVLHPKRSAAEMDFTTLQREVADAIARVATMARRGENPPPAPHSARGAKGARKPAPKSPKQPVIHAGHKQTSLPQLPGQTTPEPAGARQ